jgi:hypothetical protein
MIDFSKLKQESLDAIDFLAQVAFTGASEFREKINLPMEVCMHADNPAAPIAVFYLDEELDEDGEIGVGVTLLDYDEEEMFRPGRGDKLKVAVRPATRKAHS